MTFLRHLLRAACAISALAALLSGCASAPRPGKTVTITGKTQPGAAAPRASASDSTKRATGIPPTSRADSAKASAAKPAAGKPGVSVSTNKGPLRPSTPLIMENADRMEGSRSRGEFILVGKVRFTHGDLSLETERAVWQKDRNMVYCESGMKITQKGSLLTSDRGSYDKAAGQATAEGHVRMIDSAGDVEAFGNTVVYNRQKHLTTLSGQPELRRYYPASDSAKPGAKASGKAPSADSSGAKKGDTLVIRGKTMTYDDSLQVATAEGNVRITRDRLRIDCSRAEYHDQADSLYLLGEPQVQVDDSKVKGQVMRLGMHGEEIKSLLVKGAAQANSVEPATDTSAARQSHVEGDSLFLAFKAKAIDSVQVFRRANGSYFDLDKPEFVNKMSGEYMVLRFSGRQIQSANVLGGAKSTYYHFETKKLKGRNEAQGDTINFAFKGGKIDEVMVRGSATGKYYGEGGKKNAKADSTKTLKPDAKPAGTATVAADSARAVPAKPAGKPAAKPVAAPASTPQAAPKKQSAVKPWGGK